MCRIGWQTRSRRDRVASAVPVGVAIADGRANHSGTGANHEGRPSSAATADDHEGRASSSGRAADSLGLVVETTFPLGRRHGPGSGNAEASGFGPNGFLARTSAVQLAGVPGLTRPVS